MISSFLLASLVASTTARAFDYADLRSLVVSHDLRSVEQTLPLLPPLNVVLMHKSRSLQSASYDHPRAILFNDDASLILTYTGEERGGERFEIMTFAKDRFAFKSIQFMDGISALVNEAPTNCRGCHGFMKDDLKPIWDPGLVWRGAFGAQNDYLTDIEAETLRRWVPSRTGDRSLVENRPNLRLGLLLMRQQVKRLVRLAGPGLRSRLNAPATLDLSAGLRRFMTPIYGRSVTEDFISTRATDLGSVIAALGVSPDEIPLTIERGTGAAFDGSFPLRELLTNELNGGGRSLTEASLGLKKSPALDVIDHL